MEVSEKDNKLEAHLSMEDDKAQSSPKSSDNASSDENELESYYAHSDYDFADEEQSSDNHVDLRRDPEYFDFQVITADQAWTHFQDKICILSDQLKTSLTVSKSLLNHYKWNVETILNLVHNDLNTLLKDTHLTNLEKNDVFLLTTSGMCDVCCEESTDRYCLNCEHKFCFKCWRVYVNAQVLQQQTATIECMATKCSTIIPYESVVKLIDQEPEALKLLHNRNLEECVRNEPLMLKCPGADCPCYFTTFDPMPKRVTCPQCKTSCCFICSMDYHAPTDCATIKKWMSKCQDDSETANYISANTKDCPQCHVCIEKNGGCNHMQCSTCKYQFCWICMGSWFAHGREYYECSRFKEVSEEDEEDMKKLARRALRKYLFYYERWENHSRSLRLEQQTLLRIKERIQEKVMKESKNGNTWIHFEYLLDAANLLAKCRYTLQYTYPYAYYMENGAKKELFEYQQAQLEAEIEALSWKVERADTYDRAALENQMSVAEKRRATLLKDFFSS